MNTDLSEQRDFLLASLRDLDAEFAAGDLGEADYNGLRDDYTARAAAVLRELEAMPRRNDVLLPPETPAASRRAVVLVGLVAMASGLAGWAVAQSAGERTATDEATGSLPEGSTDRITRAQELVRQGQILEAVRVYDALLKDDPRNPVALAQRGWLLSRVDPALVDSGLASIDKAIEADPTYPDAHFFRGMILWKAKGDPAAGAASFQRAIDARPPASLLPMFEQARDEALAASSSTSAP